MNNWNCASTPITVAAVPTAASPFPEPHDGRPRRTGIRRIRRRVRPRRPVLASASTTALLSVALGGSPAAAAATPNAVVTGTALRPGRPHRRRRPRPPVRRHDHRQRPLAARAVAVLRPDDRRRLRDRPHRGRLHPHQPPRRQRQHVAHRGAVRRHASTRRRSSRSSTDNDLALIKIDATGLAAATIGDSSTLQVGQTAIAIGSPLGTYTETVTQGIISATGRDITVTDEQTGRPTQLHDLLQTDAAINPGNSGGPLLNASGAVIGINTAVAASAEGLGFAIPISAASDADRPGPRARPGWIRLSVFLIAALTEPGDRARSRTHAASRRERGVTAGSARSAASRDVS